MATWTWTDRFVIYTDVGSDSRQSSIQRNYTGTNYNNTAAFDYFSDSASVNDTIYFAFVKRYWSIKINVGTAFAATSQTFVWEYQTAASTWAALRVDNINALLTTGVKEIRFTPPDNWHVEREKGFGIRCRLSAVSGLTEGGANATDKVKFNYKGLRVTGTETTMDAAVTANNSGTYNILPATTSATGLIPIQMSVGLIRDISKVDVVLAGTSAGAGDTVDLTGTDLDGNALTETIDVSGGNATYTSTLAYADLTQVDCNGFTDGTTTVNQKKWGTIEKITDLTYNIASHLCVGDGSTTTTLTLASGFQNLLFKSGAFWYVLSKGTFTYGQTLYDGTVTEDGYGGGLIMEGQYDGKNFGIGLDMVRSEASDANINILDGLWVFYAGAYSGPKVRVSGTGGAHVFKHCLIRKSGLGGDPRSFYVGTGSVTLKGVRSQFDNQIIGSTTWDISNTILSDSSSNLNQEIQSTSRTFTNVAIYGTMLIWFYTSAGITTYLSCPGVTTASFGVGYNGVGGGNEKLRISYSLNLIALDEAGNPIESATVKITNGVGAVTSTTTDSDGIIAQQTLVAYSGSYVAFSPAITWVDKSAYTIEVKKNGYLPEIIKIDLAEALDEVVILKRANIQIDQEGGVQ